jgi:YidC/Oxa1 family membrane protein insertase
MRTYANCNQLGGEAGMSAASAKLRNAMMYGLPLLAVVFTSFAPAAVQISFCAAAGLSLCTTTILRQPGFRKMLGLAPRIVPAAVKPAGAETGPYKGTINVAGRVKSSSTTSGRNTPFSATSSATATAPKPKMNPFNGLVKTVTDYVGDVLPDAKARAESRMKKSMNSKSDQYESKRAKQLEKEKWAWEDAQRAAERERRRR